MNAVLYRSAAIEARQHRLVGEVGVEGRATRVLFWYASVLIALGVALVAICFVSFARVHEAVGRVRISTGAARVMAMAPGRVLEVKVKEGDRVKRGQELVTLSQDVQLASGSTVVQDAVWVLSQERDGVARQLNVLRDVERQEALKHQSQVQLIKQEIEQAGQQMHSYEARVLAAKRQVDSLSELADKGFVSRQQLDRATDALLEQQGNRDARAADLLAKRSRLSDLERQHAAANGDRLTSIGELEQRVSAIQAKLVALPSSPNVVITSPMDGVVSSISVRPGQSVLQGDAALQVAQGKGGMTVHFEVPSVVAARLKAGNAVTLSFAAYPKLRYGAAQGTVLSVAPSAIETRALANRGEGAVDSYVVQASIDRPPSRLPADEFKVLEGMPVTVSIAYEKASVFARALSL